MEKSDAESVAEPLDVFMDSELPSPIAVGTAAACASPGATTRMWTLIGALQPP